MSDVEVLKRAIRDIPDFPKPGILFKDITPVLGDPALFRKAVGLFVDRHRDAGVRHVAAVEARGFILGAALALELGAGVVPVRKKGKLPYKTIERAYALEYGEATLQVHEDALSEGDRVILIDDLLATGGTAAASAALLEALGADVVEIDFLVELSFLDGRSRLKAHSVYSPIVF